MVGTIIGLILTIILKIIEVVGVINLVYFIICKVQGKQFSFVTITKLILKIQTIVKKELPIESKDILDDDGNVICENRFLKALFKHIKKFDSKLENRFRR